MTVRRVTVWFPNTYRGVIRYVGVVWFVFHVLQLLSSRLTQQNLNNTGEDPTWGGFGISRGASRENHVFQSWMMRWLESLYWRTFLQKCINMHYSVHEEVWSMSVYSKGNQNSLIGWHVSITRRQMLSLKHVQFEVLPKLLKVVNFDTGCIYRHESLPSCSYLSNLL